MTATTSSTQSSIADAPPGTGSDIPIPRMSNQSTRANATERRQELLHQRLLPERLEVARPVEDEDEVAIALAEDLIGELRVAAT